LGSKHVIIDHIPWFSLLFLKKDAILNVII